MEWWTRETFVEIIYKENIQFKSNHNDSSCPSGFCLTNNDKSHLIFISPSCCLPFLLDEASWHLFHFFQGVPGECICVGSAPLFGPSSAEDLSPGLLLCGHRNRHQPTRGHTGAVSWNFCQIVSLLRSLSHLKSSKAHDLWKKLRRLLKTL